MKIAFCIFMFFFVLLCGCSLMNGEEELDNSHTTSLINETTTPITTVKDPFMLLGYEINGDGNLEIDTPDTLCPTDEYVSYLFGTWDGLQDSTTIPDGRLIIDFSEKSNIAKRLSINSFYKLNENVICFIFYEDRPILFWLDMRDPGSLYYVSIQIDDYEKLCIPVEIGNALNKVGVLIKTDLPINEPTNGFINEFRVSALINTHGIPLEMFFYIEYSFDVGVYRKSEARLSIYDNDDTPLYLVSEESDKIVFSTTLKGVYVDYELDVICTLEKNGGEWKRTVEAQQESLENAYKVVEIATQDNPVKNTALQLLDYWIDDKGNVIVDIDQGELGSLDEYRKYYYGIWDGWFKYEGEDRTEDQLIIDDSQKNNFPYWLSGGEIRKMRDDVILSFSFSEGGIILFWLDKNNPDMMYYGHLFGMRSGFMLVYGDEGIHCLTKTNLPINQPEDDFISKFQLLKIAQEHEIPYEMLFEINYGWTSTNGKSYLGFLNDHSYWSPIYLVSQEENKFTFKSTLFVISDQEDTADVVYHIQKVNGIWERTIEIA